ncbi:MAG: hypothetical protein JNM14_00645 [Ferruginibacter sp.]|nr:hypothetical protein [Ferruginibacter sp.]
MKRIFSITVSLFLCMVVFGQRISKITITGSGSVSDIVIGLDENVQVYLTKDGQISKWGFDRFIGYQENYNDYLEPYVGRVEYYSQNDDAALRGKVKYIGKTMLTYYPSYEMESLRGKLKSIGSLNMVYYQAYEDKAMAGSLKTIGQQNIEWYASYENEGLRGKLKGVGGIQVTYFGSFEDKAFRGKLKSIGSNYFTYYSSSEQYSGSMKSGATTVTANGIKFYVRGW